MKTKINSALAIMLFLLLNGISGIVAYGAEPEQKASPVTSINEEGFSWKSSDGAFKIILRGYVQFDGRFFFDDELKTGTDTFLVRRARPIVEGTVYKYFSFKIMPDFGNGQTILQDAYGDISFSPKLVIRAGKFKPPVGLERLQSGADILFVERAYPTNLVPNRDVGFQVSGDLVGGAVNYAASFMNGVVDGGQGDLDTEDGKDGAARIFFLPLKAPNTLGIGIAASYGDQNGALLTPSLPVYRTIGQNIFFNYRVDTTLTGAVLANGTRVRWSPQGYFYHGPFGLLAEYVNSSQDVIRDVNTATIDNSAWQLAASYFLTGEKATYKRVKTKKNFNPAEKSFGAFQIKARYTALDIDDDAFPIYADPTRSAREAKAWGAGFNWFFNNNFLLLVDYDRTTFKGGAPTGNRPAENALMMRLQVLY